MENKILRLNRKKDSVHSLCKGGQLLDDDSSKFSESRQKKLIKRANSQRAIVVNIIQSQVNKAFLKDLFFRRVHGFDYGIPKHMVSVDEKYLRRCLEFIHISALKAARCNVPVNLGYTNIEILSERYADFIRGDTCDSGELLFECPKAARTGNEVTSDNAAEQWNLGTVMGSKSMINILNSRLFHQWGAADSNDNLSEAKGSICYDFMDSPSGLSISSYKLENEAPMVKCHRFGSSVNESFVSTSSMDSTCSDCLPSNSPTPSHGMLQCTWRKGSPHFVFSTNDQKEVYVAILRKIDPTDVKALDYVYLFYLKRGGQKGCKILDNDLQLVGKMNVSTTSTLCPNSHRVMETEFTLFGNNEMYTSSLTQRKNKGLSKKVSQVFRTSPSSKQKTLSKFGGLSAMVESCPQEPYALGRNDLSQANIPPNFELAAIVVKNHLPSNRPNKVGGWGLKFLNKSGVKQATLPSESCQNTGDCSATMSILIPTGLHGGPRTRNDGPSSLIDRWRSGGCCDCGGWDEGCPLTVLQRRSCEREVLSQVDMQGEWKSVDLVTQGSSNFSPTLRMVNVHDGLYLIHSQPPVSALQSLSIAVAIIHSQNPTLRPRNE
ncbi:uncharacterized protein G2W53_005907 [Senna tora]|uniref:Uncharacterized protein n=1 Tax=Senna tora TaxID=362788 RepID=A0A834X3J7_9FABA|nr:uncharacterized protein G2W53_005907 [Senna tora]